MKNGLREFINEERGDVSVKGIAILVATIVVIGAVMVFFKDNIGDWITDIWEWVWESVTSWFS